MSPKVLKLTKSEIYMFQKLSNDVYSNLRKTNLKYDVEKLENLTKLMYRFCNFHHVRCLDYKYMLNVLEKLLADKYGIWWDIPSSC